MELKKLNNKFSYAAVPIILLLILMNPDWNNPNTIQGTWDIMPEVLANGYENYLVETADFDYSTPIIYNMAKEIKSQTSSAEEAVKMTLKTVASTIRYSPKISIEYCYNEKASTVAESGIGDCVSMSRLVTAVLRAQGIPARTKGGCLSSTKRCIPLFATILYLEPQVTEMSEGDFKKRGYLHEWVEAWLPTKGWQLLESTSGQIYQMECNTYLEYGYDSNQYDRCIIQSSSFWGSCSVY